MVNRSFSWRMPMASADRQPPDDHRVAMIIIAAALSIVVVAGLAFFVADLFDLIQSLERSAGGGRT